MDFVMDTTPWTGGKVTDRAWCVLGDNASPMTYTGTNTWILHEPESGVAVVVDPAPSGAHVKRIQEVCAELGVRVAAIILTHHHFDHTEGAADLALATGAPIFAHNIQRYQEYLHKQVTEGTLEAADRADELRIVSLEEGLFGPDQVKAAGGWALGSEAISGEVLDDMVLPELEVIAMPGHSRDSVVLQYAADRSLVTGDLVFRHGPTVVYHPDGILKDYLDSLDRLERIAQGGTVDRFLPGHGYPIDDMVGCIEASREHRLLRLQQIEDALAAGTKPAVDPLIDAIYTDTDPRLRPATVRSVQAQLEYLGHPTSQS